MSKRVPRAQANRILAAREGSQDALEPMFTRELNKHQQAQASRATDLAGAKAFTDPMQLVPASDVQALNAILHKYETAQWAFTSEVTGQLVGAETATILTHRAQEGLLSRAKGITDATRRRMMQTIERGIAQQMTDRELGRALEQSIASPARARMIARTEQALIDQQSATDRYKAGGVQAVEVFDGSGCGWTHHDDADKANGSIRTLDQAEAQPLSHPNCRRGFLPVTEVDVPDTSAELEQWQAEQQEAWEAEGLI